MITLDLIHRNKILCLSLVLECMVQDLKFSHSAVIIFHVLVGFGVSFGPFGWIMTSSMVQNVRILITVSLLLYLPP